MSTVFEYTSYKDYLRHLLLERSEVRGYQSQLSKAAGCQASYLSQALKTKVELTPDHAVGIGSFMQMNETELDYFLSLVLYSRATLSALKELLAKKLEQMRQAQKNLSQRL